jgi:hypothetical protein
MRVNGQGFWAARLYSSSLVQRCSRWPRRSKQSTKYRQPVRRLLGLKTSPVPGLQLSRNRYQALHR